jgi:hypothetical protein
VKLPLLNVDLPPFTFYLVAPSLLWLTALLTTLAKAHAEGRLEEKLGFYAKPKLLIVRLPARITTASTAPPSGLGEPPGAGQSVEDDRGQQDRAAQ